MSSTLDIQVPQWSTISDQPVLSNLQTTGTNAWSNTLLFRNQGSSFKVVGNTLTLSGGTQNAYVSMDSNSKQQVQDVSNNRYQVTQNVYPAPMTVSGGTAITLQQYRSDGLPVVFTPTSNASGQVNINQFPTTLSGTFTGSSFVTPTLPNGLTSNSNTIVGTPIVTRPNASTYTQVVRGDLGRLLSQAFTLSVQNPQVRQTNVSGFTVNSNQQLLIPANQGISNDYRVSIDPIPNQVSVVGLPPGLSASLVSGNVLVISGVPTNYPSNGIATATVSVQTSLYSSNTTLTLSQTPTVVLSAPNFQEQQSNVPFNDLQVSAFPQAGSNVTVNWTLDPSAGLTVNPTGTVATLSGIVTSNTFVGVRATLSGTDVSSQTTISLNTLTDEVIFSNGNSDVSAVLQTEQQQNSGSEFFAFSKSTQPISQSVTNPVVLNDNGLFLNATGFIAGYPTSLSSTQFSLSLVASTPQDVSSYRNLSLSIVANTISFDPSQNFLVKPPRFIQGRPIELDQTSNERTYRATTAAGSLVTLQQSSALKTTLSDSGLTIVRNALTGTPATSFSSNVDVTATRGRISNTLSLGQFVAPDQWVLAQPTQSDFILAQNETQIQTLQSQTQSETSISEQSLSGVTPGVSVSTDGVLTLEGIGAATPTPFVINALTYAGITLSKSFTVTVNRQTFTSPTATSALMPVGSSLPVETSGLTLVTNPSNISGFTFTGVGNRYTYSNVSSGNIQPPQLTTFETFVATWPLRVATQTLSISASVMDANWIQQVQIEPITVSGTSPLGGPVYFLCPNPPAGLVWDPIANTLTGAPIDLTIGDVFTFWATDGQTTGAITIPYRTRVPQQLRGFSSPSGYTQQVRQRAIVNGAVHAVNRTAQLPDPLIATQGGSYPPDVVKPDQACIDGTVYQF